MLVHALRMREATSGAFDPSVLPLVALLQSRSLRAPEGPAPSLAEVREALSLVDAGAVNLTSGSIRLGRQGMGLTLDGVAKGYIVDRAAQVLLERGLDSHLINAGGDIRAGLARDAARPWAVAVEDPQRRGRHPSRILLRNGAVATSGSYKAPLGARGRLHHIVDPRSGGCPGHVTSVSVTAPSAMEADALATGLFVLPPGQALACIATLPERACLLAIVWAEEALRIPSSPRRTAILILVVGCVLAASAFFQRRAWCRYMCHLGGMGVAYARVGMLQIRGNPDKCRTCNAALCYYGAGKVAGCPMNEFPRIKETNAYCIFCGN